MKNFILGAVFSFIISYLAYLKKSLDLGGMLSAILLGAVLYFINPIFFALMICFFISSSLLTKYKSSQKQETEKLHEKSSRRGFLQVAASGLGALLFAVIYYLTGSEYFLIAFVVVMASANADTWASELGVLSNREPVSIIGFKPIKKGLSGGISLLGTSASFLGALFISIIFTIYYLNTYGFSTRVYGILAVCTIGGFAGSIIDSIMGATLQIKYFCDAAGDLTEREYTNGTKNIRAKGYKFISNEFVNFSSGVIAALIVICAQLLYQII